MIRTLSILTIFDFLFGFSYCYSRPQIELMINVCEVDVDYDNQKLRRFHVYCY